MTSSARIAVDTPLWTPDERYDRLSGYAGDPQRDLYTQLVASAFSGGERERDGRFRHLAGYASNSDAVLAAFELQARVSDAITSGRLDASLTPRIGIAAGDAVNARPSAAAARNLATPGEICVIDTASSGMPECVLLTELGYVSLDRFCDRQRVYQATDAKHVPPRTRYRACLGITLRRHVQIAITGDDPHAQSDALIAAYDREVWKVAREHGGLCHDWLNADYRLSFHDVPAAVRAALALQLCWDDLIALGGSVSIGIEGGPLLVRAGRTWGDALEVSLRLALRGGGAFAASTAVFDELATRAPRFAAWLDVTPPEDVRIKGSRFDLPVSSATLRADCTTSAREVLREALLQSDSRTDVDGVLQSITRRHDAQDANAEISNDLAPGSLSGLRAAFAEYVRAYAPDLGDVEIVFSNLEIRHPDGLKTVRTASRLAADFNGGADPHALDHDHGTKIADAIREEWRARPVLARLRDDPNAVYRMGDGEKTTRRVIFFSDGRYWLAYLDLEMRIQSLEEDTYNFGVKRGEGTLEVMSPELREEIRMKRDSSHLLELLRAGKLRIGAGAPEWTDGGWVQYDYDRDGSLLGEIHLSDGAVEGLLRKARELHFYS